MTETSFLFIDDTLNEETEPPLSSLTGLLVADHKYGATRCAVYEAISAEIRPEPTVINLSPPELHFSDFLRHRPDEEKFVVLSKLTEVALAHGLRIIRVGYYITGRTRAMLHQDPRLFGLSWFGLASIALSELEGQMVVPVVDAGFQQSFQPVVRQFSSLVRNFDIMRVANLGAESTISNSQNLFEVVYGDSRYSALLQLADVIGGLRRISETVRETGRVPNSDYKTRLLAISTRLDPLILHECAIALRIDGEIQGPAHAAP